MEQITIPQKPDTIKPKAMPRTPMKPFAYPLQLMLFAAVNDTGELGKQVEVVGRHDDG